MGCVGMSSLNMSGSMVDGLPTLQCLLQLCDIRRLSQEVVYEFALTDPLFGEAVASGSNRRLARARMVSVIQTMRQITPHPGTLNGWVLAPSEEFSVEGGRPHISQRMAMLLAYRPSEVGADLPPFINGDPAWRLAGERPEENSSAFVLDYSHEPWENVLAVGVLWSGSWTCCDRYRALASAVWEMTRWGFDNPAGSEHKNNSSPPGEELSDAALNSLLAVQHSLIPPLSYHKEYALRVGLLADRMNERAADEFWERLSCA